MKYIIPLSLALILLSGCAKHEEFKLGTYTPKIEADNPIWEVWTQDVKKELGDTREYQQFKKQLFIEKSHVINSIKYVFTRDDGYYVSVVYPEGHKQPTKKRFELHKAEIDRGIGYRSKDGVFVFYFDGSRVYHLPEGKSEYMITLYEN